MALTLGVKIGDVVDIADRWIAVLSVDSRSSATLICDDGQKLTVTSDDMTELVPDVWLGLGPDPAKFRLRLLLTLHAASRLPAVTTMREHHD